MTRKFRKDSVEEGRDFKSKDWSALASATASTRGKRNSATVLGGDLSGQVGSRPVAGGLSTLSLNLK